jgi:hypothetical protein
MFLDRRFEIVGDPGAFLGRCSEAADDLDRTLDRLAEAGGTPKAFFDRDGELVRHRGGSLDRRAKVVDASRQIVEGYPESTAPLNDLLDEGPQAVDERDGLIEECFEVVGDRGVFLGEGAAVAPDARSIHRGFRRGRRRTGRGFSRVVARWSLYRSRFLGRSAQGVGVAERVP